jgi:hypothetical protein
MTTDDIIREMREEAAITLEQARRYRYLQPEHGLMTALAERLEHYANKLAERPCTPPTTTKP